jgi:hypothetical protein
LGTGVVSSAGRETAEAGAEEGIEPLGRAPEAALAAEREVGAEAEGAAATEALADAAGADPDGLLQAQASTSNPKTPHAGTTPREVLPRMT